jgi:hypothetical protein
MAICGDMAHSKAVPPLTAQERRVIGALHTAFAAMMRQFDADLRREQRLRRYLFDHLEAVDHDALGDALLRITAAADHRTTVPSRTG